MNRVLVDLIALMLPPCDCEAVLGDLAESSAPFASSLFAIVGFVFRRNFLCWLSWRPWFAALALAYTTTWLLMGNSLEVHTDAVKWYWGAASWQYAPDRLTDFALSLLRLFTAAWSAGFAAARISRRTLWASTLLLLGPSIHCFKLFHVETHFDHQVIQLSPFALFLYLPIMVFGICAGLHKLRPRPWLMLLLIIPYGVQLIPMMKVRNGPNFVLWTLILLWPCWYFVWLTLPSMRRTKEAYSL